MEIFHVHTYRCGHADIVPDEEYVKMALQLGAEEIWFTDHSPFPHDPFGSRMKIAQLDEYLSTLSALKEKYRSIKIHIGLETEYFPNFDSAGFYDQLRSRKEIEILLLGQHMAETSCDPPAYSFSESSEYLDANEYKLLGNAILQGINSGYFYAVAHPDRIFRRCGEWTDDMEDISVRIIRAAAEADMPLEMNLSSVESPSLYRTEFWRLVPENGRRMIGFDAHRLEDMRTRYIEVDKRLKCFCL